MSAVVAMFNAFATGFVISGAVDAAAEGRSGMVFVLMLLGMVNAIYPAVFIARQVAK